MAILAGIDRGYVTREEGLARMERIVSFLERQTVSMEPTLIGGMVIRAR